MYAIKEMAMLQEAKGVEKIANNKIRFRAKLLITDEYSYNGKNYLKAPILEALKRKEMIIKMNGLVGEMDHPMDPSMMRLLNILYKNTSHVFKEIWSEGNVIWGILETTSNQRGEELYKLIVLDGIPVGFSLRALGEVRSTRRGKEVYKGIDIITWDTVSSPGFSSCILEEIINPMHLESYMMKNDLINLEEFLYGSSLTRHEMLLESKISEPTSKLIERIENTYLLDSDSDKCKIMRNILKQETRNKLKML
jgi:hypothetical protein